jgi:cell division protein FtsW
MPPFPPHHPATASGRIRGKKEHCSNHTYETSEKDTPVPDAKAKSKRVFITLFTLPIILSVIGLFFVFEASYVRSFGEYHDSFHYFKIQALWIFLGVIIMAVVSFFDYHKLYYFAFLLMLINIFLLCSGPSYPPASAQSERSPALDRLGIHAVQPTEMGQSFQP